MRQHCGMAVANYIKKKKKIKQHSRHRRGGKLILPDPSLSTEQMMSAFGILNLPQQHTYNKGIFMLKGS